MLTRRTALSGIALMGLGACTTASVVPTGAEIDGDVNRAIADMNARLPFTRDLARQAEGMLVMPGIIKGGLIVGGAYGEGALRTRGDGFRRSQGYYSFAAGSVGYQIGLQRTGHALFFMTPSALRKFRSTDGWEVGADAEVTILDTGIKAELNTTQTQRPVIAVVFSQEGLLAGASLEGAKYSRVAR